VGKLKTNFVMWGFLPTYLSIERLIPSAEPTLRYLGQGAIATGILLGYVSAWDYTRRLVDSYHLIAARTGPADAGRS